MIHRIRPTHEPFLRTVAVYLAFHAARAPGNDQADLQRCQTFLIGNSLEGGRSRIMLSRCFFPLHEATGLVAVLSLRQSARRK